MKKESILLTGGLGFIGSHTAAALKNNFKHIVIIDDLSNSTMDSYYRLKHLVGDNLVFYKCDIACQSQVNKIVSSHNIKIVIHYAGLKAVGESVNFPAKYYYKNVYSTKLLFEVLEENKITNLIFSSSATVYGKPLYLPLDESHPVRANNPYGQNKIDIEQMIFNNLYFQEHCSVKILRYFNPIGAHPSGLIGENPKGIPNNIMPIILKVANQDYQELKVFGNDYQTHDGTGIRDYIHIMDLVEGHVKAIDYNKKGITVVNLGTGQGFSVLDLINTFQEVNKVKIPFSFDRRRPGDSDIVFANPDLAKTILGFKSSRSLQSMCFDAWNFAKKK